MNVNVVCLSKSVVCRLECINVDVEISGVCVF